MLPSYKTGSLFLGSLRKCQSLHILHPRCNNRHGNSNRTHTRPACVCLSIYLLLLCQPSGIYIYIYIDIYISIYSCCQRCLLDDMLRKIFAAVKLFRHNASQKWCTSQEDPCEEWVKTEHQMLRIAKIPLFFFSSKRGLADVLSQIIVSVRCVCPLSVIVCTYVTVILRVKL